MLQSQMEFFQGLIRISQSLSNGEKVKLWELKQLLSANVVREKFEILDNWDIKPLPFVSENLVGINWINDDIILEKSRDEEIQSLQRRSFLLWIVWIVFFIVIVWLVYTTGALSLIRLPN
jgi:glutaredoxin-related protein